MNPFPAKGGVFFDSHENNFMNDQKATVTIDGKECDLGLLSN
jgi:hypothetical protein